VQWNAELRAGAGFYGYRVIDYDAAMSNPDGTQNTNLFNADRIHPNAVGYAAMDRLLQPLLDSVRR
jgi:lysophospholipase L1-like esterase